MRLQGRIWKEGRVWLVEIPILGAMTQGRSRRDAYMMAADLVESLAGRSGFKVTVHPTGKDELELSSNDVRTLVALLLRRLRESSGLTLAEAAERLGVKSRNAYARYEQGVSVPTIEQLNKLIAAVSPGKDFVIRQSSAA
jgi:DNA-binding XRE family transcriptional regulator